MATPATGLLNLEKDLICFICTEVLYQPLTLIDCLHTFCGFCLKEWFSTQHQKASRSHTPSPHPYTCPTCRDTVKDTRRNAMINTLLESFVAANPDKDRTPEEKDDMDKVYKLGEDIMKKVEPRRRKRRDEDDVARRERRMLEEARERSMRDVRSSYQPNDRLSPRDARDRSRSRDHDERRDRRIQEREERRQRRERVEAAENALRDHSRDDHSDTPHHHHLSPPLSSPRHPDAVEARRDAHTIAHQASLRSIASASELGTGSGDSITEAQLMQEIISEGLLDGIDVDNLTEAEQDALSEVIAERYRQLHPRQAQPPNSRTTADSGDRLALDVHNLHIEEADRVSRPRRATGSSPIRPGRSPRATGAAQEPEPTPTINPSASELVPPAQVRAHHRRASDQSNRQASNQVRHHTLPVTRSSATRSATDLSDQPQSGASSGAERPRQLSAEQRAQTEPRQVTRASELWQRQGTATTRQIHITGPQSPPHSHQPPVPHTSIAATNGAPRTENDSQQSIPSDPEPVETANLSTIQTRFEEPIVTCFRCSRSGIQYENHSHCYPCGLDLCQRCYRHGYGCNHWFGFGHGAITKFEASMPPSRNSQQMELPHILVGRQYLQPPSESDRVSSTAPFTSTSDPASRLLEGHFCDRCGTFANSCFWKCDVCNEGEWGFCNSCVNTHHCCSHALLPIAHKSSAPATPNMNASLLRPSSSPVHSAASSATSMTDVTRGPEPDFVNLSITTNCDVCTQPIPPSNSRYHCPSHPSPTPSDVNSKGDFDICTSCYHNLVKIGRIKREDGPAGWRKCPNGHRMIVTAFDADADAELRRVIVRDLIGGIKMTGEDVQLWTDTMAREHPAAPASPVGRVREWTWHDPADPAADPASAPRRTRTRQATITSQSGNGNAATTNSKFPPDGGFGTTVVAMWSYYPEEGDGGRGELLFPKRAEVREVEEINEEWSEGVYAGDRGLVPNVYVREREGA